MMDNYASPLPALWRRTGCRSISYGFWKSYLDICTMDGKHLRSRMTAENFLRLTGHDPRFLSVNRGILVNADYIHALTKKACILADGTSFPVRVRDSQKLENALRQYHFSWLRSEHHHRHT